MSEKPTNNHNLPARLAPDLDAVDPDIPTPGDYWQSIKQLVINDKREDGTVPEGTAFLVTEVEVIQNVFHSATVYVPSPYSLKLGPYSSPNWSFTADEFLESFETLTRPQDEVLAEKQELLTEAIEGFRTIQLEVGEQIKQIAAPAAASRTVTDGGSTETLPVKADTLPNIENITNAISERSEHTNQLISLTTKEISAQVQAAMFKPKKMLEKLTIVLGRIAAYSGEDVELEQIADGPRTTTPQPLSIFQAMRYMDEEYIVDLAEGGADYSNWDDFTEHLATNKETLNRLIPVEHGICIMRFRRKDKIYNRGTNLAEVYENESKNDTNRIGFLLYRDGESVWTIESPVTAHSIPSLFPTGEQLESPFRKIRRGWGDEPDVEEKIRFGDLAFKKSWDDYEKTTFAYKMLLLVLWGLQDREKLFPWMPSGPMDKLIANPEAFTWVHDDENLLGDNQANIFDWIANNQREYLQSGARILCLWRPLLTESASPGFKRLNGAKIVDNILIDDHYASIRTARKAANEFFVECPVYHTTEHWSWGRYEGEDEQTVKTVKVWLTRWERSGYGDGIHGTGFIVLDAVTLEEVERYIASREARKHYVHYIDALFLLRDILRKDKEEQSAMFTALQARHKDIDISEPFAEAVRTWRASRRGEQVPQREDGTFEKVCAQLDEHITRAVSTDTADDILKRLREAGEKPAALALTGRGRYVTYELAQRDVKDLTPAPFALRKQWIQRAKGGLYLERESLKQYSRPLPASEILMWEDKAAATALLPPEPDEFSAPDIDSTWLYSMTPQQDKQIRRLCEADGYLDLLEGKVAAEKQIELLREIENDRLDSRCVVMLVLGSAYHSPGKVWGAKENLIVWTVQERLLNLLWHTLPEDEHERLRGQYWYRWLSKTRTAELGWRGEDRRVAVQAIAIEPKRAMRFIDSLPVWKSWAAWDHKHWKVQPNFDQSFEEMIEATMHKDQKDHGMSKRYGTTREGYTYEFGWKRFVERYNNDPALRELLKEKK